MRIHAIQTGRVQIKAAQIEGRGHGLWRQLQPIVSREWAEWVPVYAWAIEHPEGVIVVDTGSGAHLKRLPPWHPYFQLAVRFDIEPDRLQFRLTALGQAVHGSIDVAEDYVRLEVFLPWLLAMLAETLQPLIRKEGTLLLEKK
jgi:hypothetical protein